MAEKRDFTPYQQRVIQRYYRNQESLRTQSLSDLVAGGAESAPPGSRLGRFTTIRKAHFHLDPETSVEVDLHAVSERGDGTDLVVEVKSWEREVTADVARRFVKVKEALAGHLERKTVFLFYSESGVGEGPAATLAEAGIPILDPAKLASYEMPSSSPSAEVI